MLVHQRISLWITEEPWLLEVTVSERGVWTWLSWNVLLHLISNRAACMKQYVYNMIWCAVPLDSLPSFILKLTEMIMRCWDGLRPFWVKKKIYIIIVYFSIVTSTIWPAGSRLIGVLQLLMANNLCMACLSSLEQEQCVKNWALIHYNVFRA